VGITTIVIFSNTNKNTINTFLRCSIVKVNDGNIQSYSGDI